MKKLISFAIIATLLFPFSSCLKKTDDDPLISLRSRKARVVNEWVAKTGKIGISNGSYSVGLYINGTTYLDSYSNTGTATCSFTFEKNGHFHVGLIVGGYYEKLDGTWNFSGGVAKEKSKTKLILHLDTYDSGPGPSLYQGNQYQITYDILELREKKMVLQLVDNLTDASGNTSNYSQSWDLEPRQ